MKADCNLSRDKDHGRACDVEAKELDRWTHGPLSALAVEFCNVRPSHTKVLMSITPPKESESCSAEWLSLSDELLAGLVHGLNNRTTALSVFAELADLGDTQIGAGGVMRAEVERLQRVTALLGMLPARHQGAEALQLEPVLNDAIELHAQHPRMRSFECVVQRSGDLQPVRVARWLLLRLLVVLVHAAKESADQLRRERVTIRLTGDADTVSLSAFIQRDGSGYATELATRCGGALARVGDELQLTLPSLTAVRRREQLTRAAD